MTFDNVSLRADVKCYYCGHTSGQVFGRRDQPLRVANFVPRKGFTGTPPAPGQRIRCERCKGPVFLEEVASEGIIGAAEVGPRRAPAKRAA